MFDLVKYTLIVIIAINAGLGLYFYGQSTEEYELLEKQPRRVMWVQVEIFTIASFIFYFIFARHYFILN